MRIHFVYAGRPNNGALHAPHIITTKLYEFLRTKAEVIYHEWTSKYDIDVQPDDIILGHPNYDPDTIIQKAFKKKCKAKCLIHPLHTRRISDNLPFNDLALSADKIFSICGPYWYDTIENTPFAAWKKKMVRLDLAIDPAMFPYTKLTFNPPTARRLVYIGSSIPNKNLGYLVKIMQILKNVTLHWYGGDSKHPLAQLPNVVTTGWVVLNPEMAKHICHYGDIKVSVSDSDANPTTLLETAAWGLIPACTKESGYYNDPMFHELYLDSIPKTLQTLRKLLTVPNEELARESARNRQIIETKYTWDNFNNKIWNELCSFL